MASTIAAVTTSGGGVVTTADASGNLNLLAGTTTVVALTTAGAAVTGTLSATGLISGSLDQVTGFKNRLINGAMVVDQRNAGASVTATSTVAFTYTLDRFSYRVSAASKFTVQQNAGSVTPPTGFINYLGVTSSSAYSVSASDFFAISQLIEGLNIADFAWGTANAVPITLSFKVYSSLTGTFGGSIANNGFARCYPFSYTISSANTWTSISITIPGDTSGTWLTTNGIGLNVLFGLGIGSTYSGTAGAWVGSQVLAPTGAVSVVGTNAATWYVTGVQLEKGSTATSFDYRPYPTELSLCQRYFEKTFPTGTAVAQAAGFTGALISIVPIGDSLMYNNFIFASEKRANPTITNFNPTQSNAVYRTTSNLSDSSALTYIITSGTRNASWYAGTGASQNPYAIHATASAEL